MVVLFLHNGGIYAFFWHGELIKGTSAKAALERGTKIKRFLRKSSVFFQFYTIFHFTEFCTMRYFEFLNSVLTKNLEMDSSFLEFFISKF
jgi:hypothetical protein